MFGFSKNANAYTRAELVERIERLESYLNEALGVADTYWEKSRNLQKEVESTKSELRQLKNDLKNLSK